jgi:uncharacterized membrane protein YkvA (DUF1232 family)
VGSSIPRTADPTARSSSTSSGRFARTTARGGRPEPEPSTNTGHLLIGFGTALALLGALVVVGAIHAVRRGEALGDLAQLVPSLARLLVRLSRDRSLPLRVRARIYLAIAYNVQPINLIPDFVPVVGMVDNVVVILWALHGTVRAAGRDAIVRNWTGTPQGLATLFRLARLEE